MSQAIESYIVAQLQSYEQKLYDLMSENEYLTIQQIYGLTIDANLNYGVAKVERGVQRLALRGCVVSRRVTNNQEGYRKKPLKDERRVVPMPKTDTKPEPKKSPIERIQEAQLVIAEQLEILDSATAELIDQDHDIEQLRKLAAVLKKL